MGLYSSLNDKIKIKYDGLENLCIFKPYSICIMFITASSLSCFDHLTCYIRLNECAYYIYVMFGMCLIAISFPKSWKR